MVSHAINKIRSWILLRYYIQVSSNPFKRMTRFCKKAEILPFRICKSGGPRHKSLSKIHSREVARSLHLCTNTFESHHACDFKLMCPRTSAKGPLSFMTPSILIIFKNNIATLGTWTQASLHSPVNDSPVLTSDCLFVRK